MPVNDDFTLKLKPGNVTIGECPNCHKMTAGTIHLDAQESIILHKTFIFKFSIAASAEEDISAVWCPSCGHLDTSVKILKFSAA